MAITVVSWNIATRREPWRQLLQMDADVALLQEATPPPDDVVRMRDAALPPADEASPLDIGPREAWDSHSWNSDWWRGRWNALYDRWPMVVRLSNRVEVEWFKQVSPVWQPPEANEIAVSGIGTVTAARVTPRDGSTEPFIAVSMYGQWLSPHPSTGSSWIVSDASAHRVVSDISAFIGRQNGHRILAAGDLNILHGYGDYGSEYWGSRYGTVFARMEALGLPFVGPQAPNGNQAKPWPDELPRNSKNVPTYRPGRDLASATRQLDYVFASRGFHESVTVRALNSVEEWGPSDHCRVLIEVAG